MELFDAMRAYLDLGRERLHMPGHKGSLPYPLTEAARWDLTEIPGTDSLYEANDCLLKLEERFATLYGAGRTLLSAGGATLCIQTMLALVGPGQTIICDRNLHVSAMHAMGLLDQHPVWIRPELDVYGIPQPPSPAAIHSLLQKEHAAAVYITSPNYYGILADIEKIAEITHKAGALLLVDNAHGAHLPFLSEKLHPLARGADICCDSLHKMLPALTGAAALHLRSGLTLSERAKTAMSLFGSTSPSYLIMLSCDLLLSSLADTLPAELTKTASRLHILREQFGDWALPEGDPLRLTLPLAGSELKGDDMRQLLAECNIEPEMCNSLAAVLLCAPNTDFSCLHTLLGKLHSLSRSKPNPPASPPLLKKVMPLREALFAPSKSVSVDHAAGCVAASMVTHCPPGIPIVFPGEFLDESAIFLLKSTGISVIDVVK